MLTYGTLIFELAIPILLFFPRTRWLGFLSGIGLHLAIMLLSTIWIFQLVILVPYIAFLDRRDMDWIVSFFRRSPDSAKRK